MRLQQARALPPLLLMSLLAMCGSHHAVPLYMAPTLQWVAEVAAPHCAVAGPGCIHTGWRLAAAGGLHPALDVLMAHTLCAQPPQTKQRLCL